MMLYQRIIISALAVSLGSCGFQPLYGTSATGSRVTNQLASINVEQQNTRTNQLIRNEIISSIGNHNGGSPTRYKLGFTSSETKNDTVTTFSSDVARKSYQLKVKYTLTDTAKGKIIHKGNTFSHVSYDKTDAPFSDYQALINAQERAAKEAGTDIRTRLAAYFASK